jgi:hypothetical protein
LITLKAPDAKHEKDAQSGIHIDLMMAERADIVASSGRPGPLRTPYLQTSISGPKNEGASPVPIGKAAHRTRCTAKTWEKMLQNQSIMLWKRGETWLLPMALWSPKIAKIQTFG